MLKRLGSEEATIDSVIPNVIANLVVEGMKATINMGRPNVRLLAEPGELRREQVRQRLKADASLDTILQGAAVIVSGTLKYEGPAAQDVEDFLRSPSALAVVRQIYASELADNSHAHLDSGNLSKLVPA